MSAALHEVEPPRRAAVALDTIQIARRQHAREHRRPAALTKGEALAALRFESLVVFVACCNVRNGAELTDEDFDRLGVACARIEAIAEEAS